MAEIRLPYRWVPSALEPLPSLTHEGPWCRDAVPTGYKLEQRSYRCRAMGFSLGQWQRHPETKRRIMVAGSGATFFDEGPPDATQSLWPGPSIGFSRHGEIFCDGTRTDAHDKAGILPMPAHRSGVSTGYSSASCFPAEPASASPDTYMESGAIPLVNVMLQASTPSGKIHHHRLTRLI